MRGSHLLPYLCGVFYVFFIHQSFGQSPGSLYVNAGPDQTIICGGTGCVDLTADFLETFETNSATYTVNSIDYDPPFSFNGLANQMNPDIDDAWSDVDQLPFDFCFFGDLVDEFQVGSNGVLRFDVNPADTYSGSNAWQFSANLPNNDQEALGEANVLLPVHDIDPSVSNNEQIGYEVLGTYPNRVLVVSYYNVPYFSCNNLRATHMAVFYEFSNIIDFYIQDKPVCNGWNSGRAALGIQNNEGTIAYVPPGRNTSNSPWTATNEAWRFSPTGDETYEFSWLDPSGNLISHDPTITVCQPGTYTAQIVYTNTCNGEQYTVTDTVVVTTEQPFSINLGADVEVCEAEEVILDASEGAPAGALYEWFYNDVSQGPATAGNSTYTVSPPNAGTYKVEVTDPENALCVVVDEVEVDFTEREIPQFDIVDTYCFGETPAALPTESLNNYSGTWIPAVIDTELLGTTDYEFTPDDGECALPTIVSITILPLIIPEFPEMEEVCQYSTPPVLPQPTDPAITGTWLPAVIDTDVEPGIYEFTFQTDGDCGQDVTISIEIVPELPVEVDFSLVYCQFDEEITLPTEVTNGITGYWIPAVIDTDVSGDFEYTFYPDDEFCAIETIFTIQILPQPILNPIAIQEICDENFDGIYVTNLNDLSPQLGGVNIVNYYFYESIEDVANNNFIPVNQTSNYAFDSLPATIYIVGETADGCQSPELAVQFAARDLVDHNPGPFNIEYCPEDTVDLTQFETDINNSGAEFFYYNTLNDAQNGTNEIQNTTTFTPGENQTSVFVRVELVDFCPAFVEISLFRFATPSLELSHSNYTLCPLTSFEATATSDDPDATFEWTMPDGTVLTGPTQTISEIGTYSVVAYSVNGCISETRTLTVVLPAAPVITNIEMGDNYVIIGATNEGQGPMEYSLDGILWQNDNRFNNLIPGETYTIFVRSWGCMITQYTLTILSVPNYFSPNNDGKNDTWEIKGIENSSNATLKIFDRYGKIFVDTTFNGNYVWNGKYLGNNVPSGDYWYIIIAPSDGIIAERKFVGHITVRNQ